MKQDVLKLMYFIRELNYYTFVRNFGFRSYGLKLKLLRTLGYAFHRCVKTIVSPLTALSENRNKLTNTVKEPAFNFTQLV